ncbi:MAG TPA: TetR/AcrR family transcriptional regulator, partial [Caulobacteraceae bacterium]
MKNPARRTRAAAKEASRAALINSALDLFATRGLDVSLDEICARAGYTRGAFYVHFKNRDELLAAAMEQVGRGSLDAALGDAGEIDLGAVMRRFGEGLASGEHPVSRRGRVRPFQLLDACARSPEIRERYVALVEEGVGRIAEVLRAHQQNGTVRPDVDPRGVATLLEAMVIGVEILHDV